VIPTRTFYGGLGTRKKPIPFPVPIDEIKPLSEYYPEPYDTLFLTCYLYGCRIGEALNLDKNHLKINNDSYGRKVLVATILTEKNRINPLRRIPAILAGETLNPFQQEETKIAEHIHEHQETSEKKLFPNITRQKAYNHFSEQKIEVMALQTEPNTKMIRIPQFKINPHFLRHCRLTHLREQYHYDSGDLMQYAGWTDTRPAAIYIQLDYKHLADAMHKEAKQ